MEYNSSALFPDQQKLKSCENEKSKKKDVFCECKQRLDWRTLKLLPKWIQDEDFEANGKSIRRTEKTFENIASKLEL